MKIVKAIAGIVVGYIFIIGFIMGTFTVLYSILGTEAAYKPGTYEVSMSWILPTFVLSFLAAVGGGFICQAIAKNLNVVTIFAGIILILGLALAVMQASTDRPIEPREGQVSNSEAMQKSIQPLWVAIANPIVGAVGILLGGRLRKDNASMDSP